MTLTQDLKRAAARGAKAAADDEAHKAQLLEEEKRGPFTAPTAAQWRAYHARVAEQQQQTEAACGSGGGWGGGTAGGGMH